MVLLFEKFMILLSEEFYNFIIVKELLILLFEELWICYFEELWFYDWKGFYDWFMILKSLMSFLLISNCDLKGFSYR